MKELMADVNQGDNEVKPNVAQAMGTALIKDRSYRKGQNKWSNRQVLINFSYKEWGRNTIKTSMYTWYNFQFKNLFLQYSKIANIYFTILIILQTVKEISISDGKPTIQPPLVIIMTISMVKDIIEDQKRHKSDKQENDGPTQKWNGKEFSKCKWRDLYTGDIIKVSRGEYIPADMLQLYSSNERPECYIETKNLDGETNLKTKMLNDRIIEIVRDPTPDSTLDDCLFEYEKPNPYLYQFKGSIQYRGEKIAVDNNNFILRGCSLRNTDFIIGVTAYVGHQSKIMMNSIKAKSKKSDLESNMNKQIILIFVCLIFTTAFAAFIYILWYKANKKMVVYLLMGDLDVLVEFFKRMGSWILIFGNFVPISQLVTVETVKFIQALIISKDEKQYTPKIDSYCIVQSSNLNEELGQVEYVFSDKTGTLTCNEMLFKKLIINGKAYGNVYSPDYDSNKFRSVQNVDFKDPTFLNDLSDEKKIEYQKQLGLCHAIITQQNGDEIEYNASSPDELALVNFSKFCNYTFKGTSKNNEMILDCDGTQEHHKLLYVIEFDSTRKRMSVILKHDNKITIYTKGADNIILARLKKESLETLEVKNLTHQLDVFAKEGLRTLVQAKRELDSEWFDQWKQEYENAKGNIEKRDELMEICHEKVEIDLDIVGATAIDDKLQDQVPETIYQLKQAGIRLWVLTGDKIETAVTIGYSCNLLQEGMKIYEIVSKEESVIQDELEAAKKGILDPKQHNYKKGLVVSGESLIHIMNKENMASQLNTLAQKCEAVLCCRVSPKMKQQIVRLVRDNVPKAVTLAIGDGANDVNMITEAHVGIGIKGLEGQQAARSSDYAIGEFKHLRRQIFVYGRECYRKNTKLVLYSFWKNIVLVLPNFWYAMTFYNWSGVSQYEDKLYQMVNIFFAFMPIILYAVFDRDTSFELLERNPKLYFPGPSRLYFNSIVFWNWIITGAMQAFLIVACCTIPVHSAQPDGKVLGLTAIGSTIFSVVMIVSNFKIQTFTNSFSVQNLFFGVGSIILYILTMVAFNYLLPANSLYGTMKHILYNYNLLFSMVLAILASFYIDNIWARFQTQIWYRDTIPGDTFLDNIPKKPEIKPITKSKPTTNKVVPVNYTEQKPLLAKKSNFSEDKIDPIIDKNEVVQVIEDDSKKAPVKQDAPTRDNSGQASGKVTKEVPTTELNKNQPKTPEQKPPEKKNPIEKKPTEIVVSTELNKNKLKTPEQKPPEKKKPIEKKPTENVKPSNTKIQEPVNRKPPIKWESNNKIRESNHKIKTLESELKKTLASDISVTDFASSMGSSTSGSTYTGSSDESDEESIEIRPKIRPNARVYNA